MQIKYLLHMGLLPPSRTIYPSQEYKTLQGARIAAGKARARLGDGCWTKITGSDGFEESIENP